MEKIEQLSKNDALRILDLIELSLNCKDRDDFIKLMYKFREHVNLQYIVCGHADIESLIINQNLKYESINISYPEEYLDIYNSNHQYANDHILHDYFKTFKIQHWRDVEAKYEVESWQDVLETSVDFGMMDGYTYGTCDENLINGTCFFFADNKIDNESRTEQIIKHTVPHLSEALKNVLKAPPKRDFKLTEREIEILNWLKEGKSSWEISVILNCSERVVNFHAGNIIKKLNVMNRTHAVVIALKHNIIKF